MADETLNLEETWKLRAHEVIGFGHLPFGAGPFGDSYSAFGLLSSWEPAA